MTTQKDLIQDDELTLEKIPPEVFYNHLERYLSYQSTRKVSLASRLLHGILSVHPINKFCFRPHTSTSHNTHQSRTIYQWKDKSTLKEVRINSFPFYYHSLVDQYNEESILNFCTVSFIQDSMQNRITDFGIINEDLFWVVFGGTYCAVVNRGSKEIKTSGFFDLEILAQSTNMIAFDGISTLYFSVKTSSAIIYLSWNIEKDTLTIIHNLETINKLPVIHNERWGYFAVLEGGGLLKRSRARLQRLIVTNKPFESPIRTSAFLSINSSFKKIWDNFVINFSTQYYELSDNKILLRSPFGGLELHQLPINIHHKWSKLIFTFNPPQKKLLQSTHPWINIKDFSVSKDEKIVAILYQAKSDYNVHIWDFENKRFLNILTIPSSISGINSASSCLHFDNHNIVVSDKANHINYTFHFDHQQPDSTESLSVAL